MGHKKYYGYKPKEEHYETILYERNDPYQMKGCRLDFVYHNGRCGMNYYSWGDTPGDFCDRHGRSEKNYIWNEENTKKLMLRTGTHNGKDLVAAINDRFKKEGISADYYITQFCEEKGIEYVTRAWY